MRPDVLVIGAGAAGASVAYHLAAAGLRVLILDPDPGRAAARAAAGILSRLQEPAGDPTAAIAAESLRRWPALAGRLLEETGIDSRLRRAGQLVLRPGEVEGWSASAASAARTRGWCAEAVERSTIALLAPGLDSPPEEGLYGPNELAVHGEGYVNALLEGARRRGAALDRRAVLAVLAGPSVLTASGRMDAGAVVACAGAWAGQLPGARMKVRPVRGQVLFLEAPVRPFDCVVDFGGEYYMPRPEFAERRVILAGTTTERGARRAAPTRSGVSLLARRAARRFPALAGATRIGAAAGLRPEPEDGRPFLGLLRPGVWAAAGQFKQGLILSPWTGQALADAVVSGRASSSPTAAAAAAACAPAA